MTKKEIKQYLRNLIDSSIKAQDKKYKHIFYLRCNKSYLRALKLSKITGKPVNKNDFKGGEKLFGFNTKNKTVWHYEDIRNYLNKHYFNLYEIIVEIIVEVMNEYMEYKGYKYRIIYG